MPLAWADPFAVASTLRDEPGLVLLESRLRDGREHRSLLAVAPCRVAAAGISELERPNRRLRAGWLGYDLGREIERLPELARDDRGLPPLALGEFDSWLEFEHDCGSVRLHGDGPHDRLLEALSDVPARPTVGDADIGEWQSSLPRAGYEQVVRRAIDYIRAGDIFQVNLSQRLSADWEGDALALYARLREHAPAPFMALVRLGGVDLISASPELFLRRRGAHIETRPIKGTRPRGDTPDADANLGSELLASGKDRAENVMIVDLARNDLGRVCGYGSVEVTGLCELESHAGVHQLVSTVRGSLAGQAGLDEIVRATFPPGSVTGAPKIRAMEIIEELEPVRRGPYCGSVVWIEPGLRRFDMSVAIRTMIATPGRLDLHVGGAIVADSDPTCEWRESMQKAAPLLAVTGFRAGDRRPLATVAR